MGSNSHRKSGSSARSTGRRRVVIGAEETVRVRYKKNRPEVESERRGSGKVRERGSARANTGAGARVANAKRDERERRQRGVSRRRFLVTAAVVAVVGCAVWGLVALWRSPIFVVESVSVEGVSHLSRADVLRVAAVPQGVTLLRLPSADITARLLGEPWIGEASVSRHFPHELRITVTERVPVAIVDAGGTSLWLIDGSGYWLGKRTAEASAAVPTIRDVDGLTPAAGVRSGSKELLNALAVLQGLSPELLSRVRTVSAPTIDRTALILPRGVQVFIGSAADIVKKDVVARRLLAGNKNVVYVNVRVVNRPTWRGLDSGN
jgi:cell division protein FtsQ